uniref:Uncharacterized protein n=1 Tax=Timema monikensis TaxID=170555 RepID=A0A7R9EJ06_9NEOP|nr:unnamed protein product [Timema monikensis]
MAKRNILLLFDVDGTLTVPQKNSNPSPIACTAYVIATTAKSPSLRMSVPTYLRRTPISVGTLKLDSSKGRKKSRKKQDNTYSSNSPPKKPLSGL